MEQDDDFTRLLKHLGQGEEAVDEGALRQVYRELRQLAARHLAGERRGHTLQPTALVHEAYLRLMGSSPEAMANRAQFFHAAARSMRQILIDHARSRRRLKRGGERRRVQMNLMELVSGEDPDELLAVNDAIRRLEEVDARTGSVVRLRVFAGLGNQETAEVLGLSKRTVEREWAYARSWLYEALK